jgi:exonuclease VII small subunit
MNRRAFTLAGFFGAIGASIGKALGYDGTPKPEPSAWTLPEPGTRPKGYLSDYTIKVGRQILRVSPDDGHWQAAPADLKSWNDAPYVMKPVFGGAFHAKVSELNTLLNRLETLTASPFEPNARELRERIRELEGEIRLEIKIRATMCDGHNGPSVLTEMHPMKDGRRLCGYCYKQETERDVQHDGSDRGEAPFA